MTEQVISEVFLEVYNKGESTPRDTITGVAVAYDGCHKLYVIEDGKDEAEARDNEYQIREMTELEELYDTSCPLRFISNWKLTKQYVRQFENVILNTVISYEE